VGFELSPNPSLQKRGEHPVLSGHPSMRGEFSLYPTGERGRVRGNEHPVCLDRQTPL